MSDYVLTAEAARIVGVVPATVRWWEKSGRLPAERTGDGTRLFKRADVERMARERRERSAAAETRAAVTAA